VISLKCFATEKVQQKVWALEDMQQLVDQGIVLLRVPHEDDIPSYKVRRLKHHDNTEILLIQEPDRLMLMLPEEQSAFGEAISIYTSYQALDDGILMKNSKMDIFPECIFITTNLYNHIKDIRQAAVWGFLDEEEILAIFMRRAKILYQQGQFKKDHDRDFFTLKLDPNINEIWFCRNEFNKLTAMLPEDY
jgi:hypothetical protein